MIYQIQLYHGFPNNTTAFSDKISSNWSVYVISRRTVDALKRGVPLETADNGFRRKPLLFVRLNQLDHGAQAPELFIDALVAAHEVADV